MTDLSEKSEDERYAERFNWMLQEEFVDYHEELLFTDTKAFNDRLWKHLQWHDGKTPPCTGQSDADE